MHVPEAYGGQGADSVATCIVIEEVARVCASSSLIPAVNKLGTMLLLAGSEQSRGQVLPSLAAGSMACYALSEWEAGSDAAAMRTRARRDGDHWVLNGTKCWITNAGESTWYTVMAVTDPARGASGISAFVVHQDDPGFSVGPKERKLGIRGSPTREIYFQDCTIPAGRDHRRARHRVQDSPGRPGPHPPDDRWASRRAQWTRRSPMSSSANRSAYRSATSRGVQFMLADMAMKTEAARQLVYIAVARAERGAGKLGFISSASKCSASDVAMQVTTDAVQLFGGYGYTRDFPPRADDA